MPRPCDVHDEVMESVRSELRTGFASTQSSLAELRRWVLIIALGMGALLGVDGIGRLLGLTPSSAVAAPPPAGEVSK